MEDDVVLDDDSRSAVRLKLVKHLAVCALLGFSAAVLLSSILYLSVTNSLFPWLYAIGMFVTGIGFFARARLHVPTDATRAMNQLEYAGAVLTILTSCTTIVIREHSDHGSAYLLLVLYSLSCTASMYALSYIVTDLFNRNVLHGAELTAKQMYCIGGTSVVVGGSCGFFFSLVDVEQHAARFGYEQWLSALISAAGGALIGYISYFAQDDSLKVAFDPLPMDDFTPTHLDGFDAEP